VIGGGLLNKKASVTSFFFSLIVLAIIVLIEAEIITANFPLKEFTRPLTILFVTIIVARIAKQILHSYFDNASKKYVFLTRLDTRSSESSSQSSFGS